MHRWPHGHRPRPACSRAHEACWDHEYHRAASSYPIFPALLVQTCRLKCDPDNRRDLGKNVSLRYDTLEFSQDGSQSRPFLSSSAASCCAGPAARRGAEPIVSRAARRLPRLSPGPAVAARQRRWRAAQVRCNSLCAQQLSRWPRLPIPLPEGFYAAHAPAHHLIGGGGRSRRARTVHAEPLGGCGGCSCHVMMPIARRAWPVPSFSSASGGRHPLT